MLEELVCLARAGRLDARRTAEEELYAANSYRVYIVELSFHCGTIRHGEGSGLLKDGSREGYTGHWRTQVIPLAEEYPVTARVKLCGPLNQESAFPIAAARWRSRPCARQGTLLKHFILSLRTTCFPDTVEREGYVSAVESLLMGHKIIFNSLILGHRGVSSVEVVVPVTEMLHALPEHTRLDDLDACNTHLGHTGPRSSVT